MTICAANQILIYRDKVPTVYRIVQVRTVTYLTTNESIQSLDKTLFWCKYSLGSENS